MLVKLWYLHVHVRQLVVEHLLGVHLHQLHLVVPAVRVVESVGEVEVEQSYGVHGVEVEVPVASSLRLLTYWERGVVYGAVLEELLVHVLHLHDELLSTVVLAVHVEHCASCVHAVAELLGVEVRDLLHVLLSAEHGVEEALQQLLVELRAEQPLESEVGMRVYVSFHHKCRIFDAVACAKLQYKIHTAKY